MYVDASQYSDNDGGHSRDEAVLLIKPIDGAGYSFAKCFQRPHRVLAIVAILFGFILFFGGLGGIGRQWYGPVLLQVALGFIILCIGLWCVYHGFGLLEFEVSPCP